MNIGEFNKLFPNAEKKYLVQDKGLVYFYPKEGEYSYDLTSPSFWNNEIWVSHLNLNKEARKLYDEISSGFKEKFLEEWRLKAKYDLEKDDTSWLNKTTLEDVFKDKQRTEFGPIEWTLDTSKKPPKLMKFPEMRKRVDFENFRAYVSQNEYFMFKSKLPDFSDLTGIDSSKIKFDETRKSTYFKILKTMYVLSYLGGMSLKNLESTNGLAASLAHFYFYYFLKKTINFPDLFKDYDASALKNLEYHFHLYKRHFVWYHPKMKLDASEFKRYDTDVVKNIHRVGSKVYYDVIGELRSNIGSDYKTFLRKDSNGLTKIGQILFQESTQVYVYCILASQVKSRFKIVNDSVKSLQTQEIFLNQLVQEKIVANDLTKLISDFRVAVKDANVRLNFCLSPGMILIPSDMKFLKNVPGYNNFITIAKSDQKFGENFAVNKTLKQLKFPVKNTHSNLQTDSQEPVRSTHSNLQTDSQETSNIDIFLSTLLAAGLVRIIVFLL